VSGDPQGGHHVDAPGGTQIAQRAEIGAFRWCLVICHLFSLLIGFLMAAFSRAATRSGTGPRLDLERVREKHGACGMTLMIAKGKATCLVKIFPSCGKWHMIVMVTPLRQVDARTHPSKRLKVVDNGSVSTGYAGWPSCKILPGRAFSRTLC
jgi:hypothetical protein